MVQDYILEIQKLTKIFPGTTALDEVDFRLQEGEIHAIVGENGAGKSTLMKIISGVYIKTSGKLIFNGNEIIKEGVEHAQSLGISMIYQELENISKLSVAENIYLGRLPKGVIPGFISKKKLYKYAKEALNEFDIDINPRKELRSLSTAEQQFVEIIKAVTVKNSKIIIMDEPTSSLTEEETRKLFSIIRNLKLKNISIIYISHRLDEIEEIADFITVLRDGKNRGTIIRDDFNRNKIITLMIGHSIDTVRKRHIEKSNVIFEVKNLSIKNKINNFNLKLYDGEILGIAGLMGSGKDELVKSLFGLWPSISKEIRFHNKPIKINHPKDAIIHGIVYLPEERKVQSLFLELSVQYNVSPLWLFQTEKKIFVNNKMENKFASDSVSRLSVKTPSVEEKILNLSGGNQQKVIFARLLAIKPQIMILNDPTRGVDVKSKETIYEIIRMMTREGTSVLFLSSEIPEICHLADRVLVLSKGELKGEYSDDEVTGINILTCATRANG